MSQMTVKCPIEMRTFANKLWVTKEWMEDAISEIVEAIQKKVKIEIAKSPRREDIH